MWQTYFQPTTLPDALALLREHAGRSRIVAGGTDLVVELQRGIRPTTTLIDISRVAGLRYVRAEAGQLRLGALATHNDVLASPACVAGALPLAQACREVGAPPIRTRATVAGNLVTASPANDTITPLMVLGAELVLLSSSGERVVPLHDFYTGVRRTVLRPDELLREIRFPALAGNRRGLFLKLGLRRAQAIAVLNVAIMIELDAVTPPQSPGVVEARIALGSVAPTIVRASEAEVFLAGRALDEATCVEAGKLACRAATPIDDLRGSAAYRLSTLAALVADGLRRIAAGGHAAGWGETPVLLETGAHGGATLQGHMYGEVSAPAVETTINGASYTLSAHKTLLDALREDAGLTGTKEGCAEGECGACAVWLDGQAVMACLVPAPQAHGAGITTIEGLAGTVGSGAGAPTSPLHPLQRAFIERGAVQCGYCIPGMLMAGAKLLDERAQPTPVQVQEALSGNICRCTGYRKIVDALLQAASERENPL
jgi:carbon-monoxide dehydrogenase medium subunit